MPVYGPAPYLEEALAGVFAQSPAPERGGRRRRRLPVRRARAGAGLRRAAGCCGGIVRGGPGAGARHGARRSRPSWIAFADADDVWRPGQARGAARALERSGEAVLCFGTAEIVGADGRATGERWANAPGWRCWSRGSSGRCCTSRTRSRPPAWSFAGRGVAAGGFTGPPLCEDWSLWLRLLERGGVVRVRAATQWSPTAATRAVRRPTSRRWPSARWRSTPTIAISWTRRPGGGSGPVT